MQRGDGKEEMGRILRMIGGCVREPMVLWRIQVWRPGSTGYPGGAVWRHSSPDPDTLQAIPKPVEAHEENGMEQSLGPL